MEKKTLTKEQIEKIVAGTSVSSGLIPRVLRDPHYCGVSVQGKTSFLLAEAKERGYVLDIKDAEIIVARLANVMNATT